MGEKKNELLKQEKKRLSYFTIWLFETEFKDEKGKKRTFANLFTPFGGHKLLFSVRSSHRRKEAKEEESASVFVRRLPQGESDEYPRDLSRSPSSTYNCVIQSSSAREKVRKSEP